MNFIDGLTSGVKEAAKNAAYQARTSANATPWRDAIWTWFGLLARWDRDMMHRCVLHWHRKCAKQKMGLWICTQHETHYQQVILFYYHRISAFCQ